MDGTEHMQTAARVTLSGEMTIYNAAQIKAIVPAARAGTPQEVAALVAFLCSESAGYINGQVIGINGGMG